MKTVHIFIYGILPGGEVRLSMGLRNVFEELKKDLDKMLDDKEEQEEEAEAIITYVPSVRSDDKIFVMLDSEANFPLDRLLKNAGLKDLIRNRFAQVTKAEVKFGRRFSHWYEWSVPGIDRKVHQMD